MTLHPLEVRYIIVINRDEYTRCGASLKYFKVKEESRSERREWYENA